MTFKEYVIPADNKHIQSINCEVYMDNLLPFLPRVAHIEPLNKRLIYVAGIKDAKIKYINQQNKTVDEYDSDNTDEKQDNDEVNGGSSENQLDTWA